MEFGVALFQNGDNSPLAHKPIGDTTRYTEHECDIMQGALMDANNLLHKQGILPANQYLGIYHDQNPQWKR